MNRHTSAGRLGKISFLVLGAILSILFCGCSSRKDGGGRGGTKVVDGKTVYMQNCSGCHGPEGHGDGERAGAFDKDQLKLTRETWKHGQTPEAVRKVIVEGVGTMPPTRGLSEQELDAVVQHVLKFATREKPTKTSAGAVDGLLRAAGLTPGTTALDPGLAAP